MDKSVCNNLGTLSLVIADNKEQKNHVIDQLIHDKNLARTDDTQQKNHSDIVYNSGNSESKILSDSSLNAIEFETLKMSSENLKLNNTLSYNGIDGTNTSKKYSNIQRFQTIIDSDSEDYEFTSSYLCESKSFGIDPKSNQSTHKSKFKLSRLRINSDSDDNIDKINKDDINDNQNSKDDGPLSMTKSKKFSVLIDSESEDDNDNCNKKFPSSEELTKYTPITNELQKKIWKKKFTKKQTATKRAEKNETMQQIHSETQRLVRETSVSLPYHKPKQRSLQEFLNRKKIVSDIPQAITAAAKLRMCTTIVNKVVEEKEKEAKLFYMSSDSEEYEIPTHSKNFQINSFMQQDETLDVSLSTKPCLINLNCQFDVESIDKPMIDRCINIDEMNKQKMRFKKENLKEISSVSRNLCDNNSDDDSSGLFIKYDSSSSNTLSRTDNWIENSHMNSESSDNGINSAQTIEISSLKSSENSQFLSQLSKNEKSIEVTATQLPLTSSMSSLSFDRRAIYDASLANHDKFPKLNASKNYITEKYCDVSNDMPADDISQTSEDFRIERLPLPVVNGDEEKIKIISAVAKKNTLIKVPKFSPKLRGIPGTIIDFSQNIKQNKRAVNNLVDRFFTKHSIINKPCESNCEVTVLQTETTAEGVKINEDVLPYSISTENVSTDDMDLNKPGVKLIRLREELKKKIVTKRNEEWKQREQESMLDEINKQEEETNELESERKNESSAPVTTTSDVEESEEKNDILISENESKTCIFGDFEAEIDENEDIELSDDWNKEDEIEEELEDDEEDSDKENDNKDSGNHFDDRKMLEKKQKKFSRIITLLDDNSNSEEAIAIESMATPVTLEPKKTGIDMFIDDESDISVSLKTFQESQLSSTFKTPMTISNPPSSLESTATQFSSLNNDFSDIDFISKLNYSNSQLSNWPSQNYDGEMKNKLFNTQDYTVTDEELMALCSGKFTDCDNNGQKNDQPQLTGLINSTSNDKLITESQIIGICSGTFSSQPSLSTEFNVSINDTSQNKRLTLDDLTQNNNCNILERKLEEIKVDTGFKPPVQSFLDVALPLDDEIEYKVEKKDKKKLKKKRVRQVVLSDDEDVNMNEKYYNDEDVKDEKNEEDEDEDEDLMGHDRNEEKFIDYDSEENEVVVVNKSDLKKVAANFIDVEAELSESEWGSEDEDERDMDKLELEEGDGEEIDEDQVRAQLGKLHARQLLDDDQRDVKMLKEMLFEDGDLYSDGGGRERRFKWRNIDKMRDENLLGSTNDDDDDDENQVDTIELVNELKWRNLRMEREKFLEEKLKSNTNLDILDSDNDINTGGKFLKLGMKVLKKCQTNIEIKSSNVKIMNSIVPRTVSELLGTADGKAQILHNAMKRGSFLARGDEALSRLAAVIKQSDTVDLAPKYSKKFLFTHISPSVASEEDEDEDDKNDIEDIKNRKDEDDKNNKKLGKKRKFTSNVTLKSLKRPKFDMKRLAEGKIF